MSSAWRRVCCRSSLFSMSHAEAGGLVVGLELLEQQLLNMLEMTSYVYVQNSIVYIYIYTNKFMYIYICIDIYICINIYIYICIYICVYVCVYI